MQKKFTARQGQFLTFIHTYTKLHGRPPAEAEIQEYFRLTPPTIHQMILRLEKNGFLSRVPGQPRSLRVLVPSAGLPALMDGKS